MRMIDIICKKRDGKVLSKEEIEFFIREYTKGNIPDYQASAFTMAIIFRGMNVQETVDLTRAMMHSGDVIDLKSIAGIKVDKHSTGGVGDKTSLVLGPLVASCGVKVAKMSGRGLGHTGGTLDKLESIPGLTIALDKARFIKQVNEVGMAIIGQTGDLVPADKKLYALRDVTGTVESIPLIASSIMSKKLASGSDTILLDVKFGSGAFMKTIEDAEILAKTMVDIGNGLNRDTRAILTDMDQPLGNAVGNNLEVIEAIATLNGHGPKDFVELCLAAGAIMLVQAKVVKDVASGRNMLEGKISDGSALKKLMEFVTAQGGDANYIAHPERFKPAAHHEVILAEKSGYVRHIDSLGVGVGAMKLGAGRETKEDKIDMSAGVIVRKKVGDFVDVGDVLADVYTEYPREKYAEVLNEIHDAFLLSDEVVKVPPIVHKVIQ